MCSRIAKVTSFMEAAPRLKVVAQSAAVALPVAALLIAADGLTGRGMATALEELSLVLVLLVLHLVLSRLWGGGKVTRLPKKLGGPLEQVEDDSTDIDSGASEGRDSDESDERMQRDVGMMTTQIRAAVRVGDMATAEGTLERMQETCGEPGLVRRACWSVSYGEVVSGFCRTGKVEKAEHWLRKFVSGAPRIRPSTACVNMVTDARARRGDMVQAEEWLAQMPRMGVKVDAESYGVLIAAYAGAGNAIRAMYWLKQMRKANLVPTSESQRQVLQAVARMSEASSSDDFFEAAQGLKASTPAPLAAAESRSDTDSSWRSAVPAAPAMQPLSIQPQQDDDAQVSRLSTGSEKAERGAGAGSYCGTPCESEEVELPREEEMAKSGDKRAASALEGFWSNSRGETFEVWSSGLSTWTCLRSSWSGDAKEFPITYDGQDGIYWWGAMKQSWMDPADLEAEPEILAWYSADDWDKQWPVFKWRKVRKDQQPDSAQSQSWGKWAAKSQAPSGASKWVAKTG